MGLPRITVLSTGGTISSVRSDGLGVEPTLRGEELVSEFPEMVDFAEVPAASFRQAASGELAVEDSVELAGEVEARLDAGAAGVVITQGADTEDETAFVLDLLVDREGPVAVTGAMSIAERVPSAMVFVPCEDGISHSPEEDADPADAALGAEIMLNAITRLVAREG